MQAVAEGRTMAEKVTAISTATTYATSGSVGMFGLMTFNELMAAGGLLLAFATFFVNWYYKQKMLEVVRARDEAD